ncbi:MAG TPA: response regulator transcription factor [Jatrophihabitantaceae bacterium]
MTRASGSTGLGGPSTSVAGAAGDLDTEIEYLRVRLLVVDPHPLVRWALSQIAATRGDLVLVGESAAMDEAVALAYAVKPDVITIDDSLAGDQTWQLAAHMRSTYPDIGIVILSADGGDQTLFRALDVGASAFVAKSAPIQDVVAAIRGAAIAPSSFAAAGLAAALRRRRESSERMALSPRESEILFLLHDGLSVPEIAAQLYVSLSTAKTYVARLYDKLGARNRAQALMTAVRLGMFDNRAPVRQLNAV